MIKKYINIIIVPVILIFILTSCGTKTTGITTTTKATQEVASSSDETSVSNTNQEVSTKETSGVTETIMIETTEPTQTESIGTTITVPQTSASQTTTPQTTIPETEASALNALKITGNVAFEMTITLDELKSLDDIIVEEDYYSVNSFGTKGHTRFKGVNLWFLLDQYAGIGSDASSITILATDGYKMTFTVEQVKRQDYLDETDLNKKLPMIIVWEENGTEYNPEDGAPYKLAVGQIATGDVNKPQWVSKIDSIIVE
ncbi:MAG: molybdopterin-dependent oxidoreductase [Eubacteriales bacterium]|nr:molybdopterin-dependent oxidoreductase [Eubacteriales bacterium]